MRHVLLFAALLTGAVVVGVAPAWWVKGHESIVSSVAFSSDGGRLATGSDDGSAKLWDVNTGKELFTFKEHGEAVSSVAGWTGRLSRAPMIRFQPLPTDRPAVLVNIQALRALAALLVVFVHLKPLAVLAGLDSGIMNFGNAGVDVFFVISGVIMVFTVDRGERRAWDFLAHRIVRIAQVSGRPVTYSLLQFMSNADDWQMMVAESERANAAGLRIHPQVAGRGIGALTTLEL